MRKNLSLTILMLLGLLTLCGVGQAQQEASITLDVDATEAPRRLLHARLTLPVKPGPLTLCYPKWIPGEHGPTGPIVNLSGLKLSAGGNPVTWRRDSVEMYNFHCTVPAGADTLNVELDYLAPTETDGFSGSASTTPNLAVISWNTLLLYPQGKPAADWKFAASLRLPVGWKHATALPVESESADALHFKPVSLVTLIDSPVAAGRYLRAIPLSSGAAPPHELDIFADSQAALAMPDSMVSAYKRLVNEAGALFGARHYGHYNFLLMLSDHIAGFGLEHHECSDDQAGERSLLDDDSRKQFAGLLEHEFVHSWNGKYRRPDGLATSDYQQPMRGDLLWIYEGLTDYLGNVLTARTGDWTTESYREFLAANAAGLDNEPGRRWRPLADTAVNAQVLYSAPPSWGSARRGTDFYGEGDLIWLEVDTIIRQQTQNKKSLDDFCRSFYGGLSGAPELKTFNFEDVVHGLNAIAPYDWRALLNTRLNSTAPHAPLGGIENAGWRLVYTDQPNENIRTAEAVNKFVDCRFTLGLAIKEDGTITDVIAGTPAAQAGLGPGMKLIAVNSRKYSADLLREAIRNSKAAAEPIELLAENGEFYKTYRLDYHGGDRCPHLERDATKPDLLLDILKPHTAGTQASRSTVGAVRTRLLNQNAASAGGAAH